MTQSTTGGERTADIMVIGAGSGNSIPGPEFSGERLLFADDAPWFGGTCLNVGCIPTKMFVHVGELRRAALDAGRLGLEVPEARVDWLAVRDRIFGRIDGYSRAGERYRSEGEPNIGLLRETVRFLPREQQPEEGFLLEAASAERILARSVVIAAGARPVALPELPWGPRVLSSNEIMRIDELPERLVIVGGGVIAAEFAALFHALGVRVTQLVRSRVLRELDEEIARSFAGQAAWDLREGVTVTAAEQAERLVRVRLSDGDELEAELVLVAAGRVPNADRLGTAGMGFDHRPDGTLLVDDAQRVLRDGEPVPGAFALGDIASPQQLKHLANHQARIVRENLLAQLRGTGELARNELAPVAAGIFSHPQIGVFGQTLAEARAAGLDAVEAKQRYGDTAWGWALEDEHSFAKLVVERPGGRILGGSLIGPDAVALMQPLVQAASFGQSVRGLARGQYWPHPAASEIIENLLLNAQAALDEPGQPAGEPETPGERERVR